MKPARLMGVVLSICLLLSPNLLHAVSYINSPPLSEAIDAKVGSVRTSGAVKLPIITWGGDIATILANGNSATTGKNSIFGKKGLNFKLTPRDDFKTQLSEYIKGETPYLRGTMGMINMAAQLLNKDPRIKPVVIYQMTWSNGGDCLVVKSNIRTAKDLKGKTIALQAYGPHVDYLAKILKDAGMSMKQVNIKWCKDLTATDNSPAEALYQNDVDAAFVITPDGLMLTSNNTVGTGSEGSIKGAKILLSTKTANRIIADVYAVRSDYFESHRKDVETFVHGLLLAEQEVKALFTNKAARSAEFKQMISAAALLLLGSDKAIADTEALYGDCEFVGFAGNVQFFTDKKWPRNMDQIIDETQSAFVTQGLLPQKSPVLQANWDYNSLKTGLTGISSVQVPRFKTEEVAKVIAKKQAMGTLGEGELFSFEINFKPNQKEFKQDLYASEFKKVIDLAATYGGAVITVEGHSDPHKYNKLVKSGASDVVLRRTVQAAKNLSMNRALEVRNTIIKFARENGVPLDESQFTVVGHGISQPKYPNPRTKEQWLANMRVVFRIIQIEAEDSVFEPL